MRNLIFKFQLIVGFILFACMNVQADDDLITKQITIKLDEAGTLPNKIGDTKKYKITNLKIIGEINGTDLRLIRDMAGSDYNGNHTDGKLATLDLSEAKIVAGGDSYYWNGSYGRTSNDVIGSCAFYGCSSLTSIGIPSGVVSIGGSAFSGCSGLTSLTIPSGVTSIDDYAFEKCSGLTSLTIHSSVKSISWCAFRNSEGGEISYLKDCKCLLVSDLETYLRSSHDFGVIPVYNMKYYQNGQELTKLEIPSGVSKIGNYSFYKAENLNSLTIPSSVTSIGESAFEGCSGLTSLSIPSNVTEIGKSAFNGCSGLTSVYVSWNTPISISASTFKNANTKNCILYVPKGTYDDYWLTDWGVFENIVEYDVAGINQTAKDKDAQELSRYSVSGQRLNVPTKGVNIVRYSDGNTRKVVTE